MARLPTGALPVRKPRWALAELIVSDSSLITSASSGEGRGSGSSFLASDKIESAPALADSISGASTEMLWLSLLNEYQHVPASLRYVFGVVRFAVDDDGLYFAHCLRFLVFSRMT